MIMSKDFAKIYNTNLGQILITLIPYKNIAEISVRFNDDNNDDGGVHELKLMFDADSVKTGEPRMVFESLNEINAHQLIMQAIAKSENGIVQGTMADIDDIDSVRH